MGLPLCVVWICSRTPLEKTYFSFASSCQSEIASGLRMGVRFYFPLSVGTPSGSDSCWSSTCCHLWIHRCGSPVVSGRQCFLGVFPPHWLSQSYHLFCTVPWALRGRLWWSHPIKGLNVQSSLSAYCLAVDLHFPPSPAEGSLSDAGWAAHWPMGIAESHQELFYCYAL